MISFLCVIFFHGREYETYIHKMEAHQKLVKDYEKNLPHFQELIQQQENVKILQQQSK